MSMPRWRRWISGHRLSISFVLCIVILAYMTLFHIRAIQPIQPPGRGALASFGSYLLTVLAGATPAILLLGVSLMEWRQQRRTPRP